MDIVAQALADIAAKNGGQLLPAEIVAAARDVASPLHAYFDWDDTSAGDKYRLVQAGMLIRRVKLHLIKPAAEGVQIVNVRAYHSLTEDRGEQDGGYTPISVIMADEDKMESLYAQAFADLKALERKYENLVELEGVWKEAATARAKMRRRKNARKTADLEVSP